MKLFRMSVEGWDAALGQWFLLGSVLLPDEAPAHMVEHALAVFGIYAPRGADVLDWRSEHDAPLAFVESADGQPIAALGFMNAFEKEERTRP